MSMSEEQMIEFIISKIDIQLEHNKDVYLSDALYRIAENELSEKEKKVFVSYFYRLHKGYSKYKHINLAIEYHKILETLVSQNNPQLVNLHSPGTTPDNLPLNTVLGKPMIPEDPELDSEIDEVETLNKKELVKLKSFFFRASLTVFLLGIAFCAFMLVLLDEDAVHILWFLDKYLN